MPIALTITDEVVEEAPSSASDLGHAHRFTVKTGMRYWVDVDYTRPTRARQLLTAGQHFDTDDLATHNILVFAPEFTDAGALP